MQWWIWPLSAVSFILLVFVLNRWTRFGDLKIKTLDIIVIPVWVILHVTMGYCFGISLILWFLLVWCFVGAVLVWFLLQGKWHWRLFWHKYWEWSGLVGTLLLLIVTIVGFWHH